eukprot:PhM_4_TR7031/c0_g2_i1/m.11370
MRRAAVPFGINVFIGMSMFTTYDLLVELFEHNINTADTHSELPVWTFFASGAAAGVVQSTLSSPYSNMYSDYIKRHQSYVQSLKNVWHQGKLFHNYHRLLATEVAGLTMFFGGYEASKRIYSEYLFKDRLKVVNVVAAGMTAGMLYNVVSYPVSRMHLGPSKMMRGLTAKKAMSSMAANAFGFLLYELTLSEDDTFLQKKVQLPSPFTTATTTTS